jgi:hypothetical protein
MPQTNTRQGFEIGVGWWQQVKPVTLILGLATMVKYAARLASGGLAWFQHRCRKHRTRTRHARFVHVVAHRTRMRGWWRRGRHETVVGIIDACISSCTASISSCTCTASRTIATGTYTRTCSFQAADVTTSTAGVSSGAFVHLRLLPRPV